MKNEKKNLPVKEHTHLKFEAHLLENEIWLTTEEIMEHLNVSRSTIYRLRKKHNIPNFKLGHSPMYPKLPFFVVITSPEVYRRTGLLKDNTPSSADEASCASTCLNITFSTWMSSHVGR